jgi:hypothetical protein
MTSGRWEKTLCPGLHQDGDEDMATCASRSPASTTSPRPSSCCAHRPSRPAATSVGAPSSSSPSARRSLRGLARSTQSGNMSNDRRFFARTGELLYLMLSARQAWPELGDKLGQAALRSRAPHEPAGPGALQGAPQRLESARSRLPAGAANPRFDRCATTGLQSCPATCRSMTRWST